MFSPHFGQCSISFELFSPVGISPTGIVFCNGLSMSKISQNQMAKLFQRLATSYTAGIDIRSILKRETETGSTGYRLKAAKVANEVANGKSLAEAMKATGGYFPELAISVVHAGERGGRLEQSFRRLADHYSNLVSFRNRFLIALAWPAFELLVAILLVGGMMAICDWIFGSLEMEKINWLFMGSTVGNVAGLFPVGIPAVRGRNHGSRGNGPRLVWLATHANCPTDPLNW